MACLPSKVQALKEAVANGWHVDLYCALEACHHEDTELADELIANISQALPATVVNCTWWPKRRGIFTSDGALMPPWNSFHPAFPYQGHTFGYHLNLRRSRDSGQTVGMLHKFSVTKQMRAGRHYDAIWRTRPDTVVRGISWSLVRSIIGTAYYIVSPDGWIFGHHSDVDVVLSAAAANRWDDGFFSVAPLVQCGCTFHPETLIHENMIAGGFECVLGADVSIQQCSEQRHGAHLLNSNMSEQGGRVECSSLTPSDFDDPYFSRRNSSRETYAVLAAVGEVRRKAYDSHVRRPEHCNGPLPSPRAAECLSSSELLRCIDPRVEDLAQRKSPYTNRPQVPLHEFNATQLVWDFIHLTGCNWKKGLNGWLKQHRDTAAALRELRRIKGSDRLLPLPPSINLREAAQLRIELQKQLA